MTIVKVNNKIRDRNRSLSCLIQSIVKIDFFFLLTCASMNICSTVRTFSIIINPTFSNFGVKVHEFGFMPTLATNHDI